MANDLIELDLVVNKKGLKTALNTVERLERQLTKAAKAIDSNRISQERYNKILLQSKRDYQQLGMSSQQATATVRKFAEAQRGATQATNTLTGSVEKQTQAQMAATKSSNRMGVATQQLGYQVSDFVVQVQSGTNKFVAFGQQASQLVGILPLVADKIGLTAKAAIGLSAGLGIIIPLLTAVGAYLSRMESDSDKAAKAAEDLDSKLKSLDDTLEDYAATLKAIQSGVSLEELFAVRGIETAEEQLNRAKAALEGIQQLAGLTGGLSVFAEEIKEILGVGAASAYEAAIRDVIAAETRLALLREKEADKRADNFAESSLAMKQELELMQAQAKYGADSAEANRVAIEQELRNRKASIDARVEAGELDENAAASLKLQAERAVELGRQIGITTTIQEGLIEGLEIYYALQQEVVDKQKELADAVKGITDAVEKSVTELEAENRLLEANLKHGKDSAEVQEIKAQQAREEFIAQQQSEGILGNHLKTTLAIYDANVKLTGEIKARNEADKPKATGKTLTNIQDTIDALRTQTAQETKLLGLTGERLKEEEIFYKLVLANKKADIKLSEEKLRSVAKEIAKQKQANEAVKKAKQAALDYAKALDDKVISAIDGVSNAWADFVMRGFQNFSSFKDAIINSFKNMLAQMIAMAAKNQIMVQMGIGGTATAALAGSAAAGTAGGGMLAGTTLGAGIGAGTAALGAGFGSGVASTLSTGIMGGFTNAAAIFSQVGGGITASLGALAAGAAALIAPLAVVVGLFKVFTGSTRLVESGLQGVIKTMDATFESFQVIRKKRLFKTKYRTSTEALDEEAAKPLIEAIQGIQTGVMEAADVFGIAADVFDNFTYDFKLQLKGLSEEEKIQKITEEMQKMGDSFVTLTGHFETMNELIEAANQRLALQNRLDQLLGNTQALLTRQREAELAAMHELNRPLAEAIYALEDANASVANSFAALRASIDAEKVRIQDSFATVLDGLKERLGVVNEALSQSRNVYEMLSNALSSRSMQTDEAFSGRRSSALSFLRGGDFTNEKKLEEALDVVAEPSEQLFGSFTDYQRDFYTTSRIISEAAETAEKQLTSDEQQVLLLEQQIADAEAARDEQLDALEQQYQTMVDQYNALMGIDTGIKSVAEAIGALGAAMNAQAAAAAVAAAASAATPSGGSSSTSSTTANAVLTGAEGRPDATLERLEGGGAIVKFGNGGSHAIASEAGYDVLKAHYGFAQGGYHTGGIRMVGERGPEIEATGPSRIFSHNQTASMFKDPELKDAVHELRREVSSLRSEQRQMQATNAKYVKRNYDINRKWDVDGLPATRT